MALGRLRIAAQLSLLVSATSLATIIVLGMLWVAETHSIVEVEIEERATTMIQAAADLLATPLAYGDTSSADRLLASLVREDALDRVYVVAPSGVVVASHGQDHDGDPHLTDEAAFALQALGSDQPLIRTHGAHLDIAVPILLDGRPMGVLSGETSFEDAMSEILAALPRLLLIGLLVALAAGGIAVAIGRYIAAPLKLLADAATAVGEGRLEPLPFISRGGEVGTLAAAFGRMVEDLRNAQADVAEQQRTLEARVARRTADLERALADLREASDEREQLTTAVRELASPVMPVLEGILVMPLIGVVDSQRAADLTAALLRGIQQHHTSIVIIDVTGVPIVDTQVARVLLQAAEATRLLGARTVLVGLRPELAQTIVGLGVDLSAIVTRADLQSGVDYAIRARKR
ncbi:MAG: hypothetical protein RLZZ387_3432 [Chloroflexota bacterium]|jgi:anti-anti-sigma regulatory factor/HAMP domain-containing protein